VFPGRESKEIRMHSFTAYAAAAAAIGFLAAPAAAQYAQPYAQPYAQQPYAGYGQQQPYGYNQGYTQNPVGQIIDSLLGNRYNVSDRQAVSQCASAAMAQAAARYGGNGYNQGYNRGYAGAMRVTAITDVQRRNNGLRVTGLMSSGSQYGGQYAYQNRGYGAQQLSFRCNVDYRGAVTNIRIRAAGNGYRR
jgi:hypothetical protein